MDVTRDDGLTEATRAEAVQAGLRAMGRAAPLLPREPRAVWFHLLETMSGMPVGARLDLLLEIRATAEVNLRAIASELQNILPQERGS